MIEVKFTFTTLAAAAAFMASAAATEGGTPSATITPEKQDAARASVEVGTAASKRGPGRPPKDKPAENPATPEEALAQAVATTPPAEPAKPARTYETSGLGDKIAKAAAKDKPGVAALLEKHGGWVEDATKPNGKRFTGQALKPAVFDAFEADIDALLAPAAASDDMS